VLHTAIVPVVALSDSGEYTAEAAGVWSTVAIHMCIHFSLSNRGLLAFTTFFFTLFVISEIVGGLAANSLSLLGDAAAMSIDVFSYVGNFYAEHLKSVTKDDLDVRTKVWTEIIIPAVSVASLLSVTAWVCIDASSRLLGHKNEDVDLFFLYAFAGANLVVDILCALLFYIRRHDVFISKKKEQCSTEDDIEGNSSEEESSIHSTDSDGHIEDTSSHASEQASLVTTRAVSPPDTPPPWEDGGQNLNMLSAFTHIGGDTLRTFAVLVAAILSSILRIDPSIPDAWAAVVVSVTIVVAVAPLCSSIYQSAVHIFFCRDDIGKNSDIELSVVV